MYVDSLEIDAFRGWRHGRELTIPPRPPPPSSMCWKKGAGEFKVTAIPTPARRNVSPESGRKGVSERAREGGGSFFARSAN